MPKVKLKTEVEFKLHLGQHVYVSINSPYMCLNTRELRQENNHSSYKEMMYPTSKGVSLRFDEWPLLQTNKQEVNFPLPVELDTVVPWYDRVWFTFFN